MSDKEPKLRYVRANRDRIVRTYNDKMGAMGIVSVRVSVPSCLAAVYADKAEQDRAEYFVELAKNTDCKVTLELLAKSNRVKLLSHEEVERLKANFPKELQKEAALTVASYQAAVKEMLFHDNAAALAENEGKADEALRHNALTFAWSCHVRLAKTRLSAGEN